MLLFTFESIQLRALLLFNSDPTNFEVYTGFNVTLFTLPNSVYAMAIVVRFAYTCLKSFCDAAVCLTIFEAYANRLSYVGQ